MRHFLYYFTFFFSYCRVTIAHVVKIISVNLWTVTDGQKKCVTIHTESPQTYLDLRKDRHRLSEAYFWRQTVRLCLCYSAASWRRIFLCVDKLVLTLPFIWWAIIVTCICDWHSCLKVMRCVNATGWGGNDSSPRPPINIPLHPTHLSGMNVLRQTKSVPGFAVNVHCVLMITLEQIAVNL